MAVILETKPIADKIKSRIKAQVASMQQTPKLIIHRCAGVPESSSYYSGIVKDCQECGINYEGWLDGMPFEGGLIQAAKDAAMESGTGFIILGPYPNGVLTERVFSAIDPRQDVDCANPKNFGALMKGQSPAHLPCTPAGILLLLKENKIPIEGKHCVVIGRSATVGKPTAALMLSENATVTVCHSKTENLPELTRQADIVICAVGKPKFLTGNMIRECAAVVDVGVNRDEDGKLCGDLDFDSVFRKASYVTRSPGGISLLTRAMLMWNATQAALSEVSKT